MRRHVAVLGLVAGLLLLVVAMAALAQVPTASTTTTTIGPPQDPVSQIVQGVLQLAGSGPGGVAAAMAGLYALGPRIAPRLGLGTDPAVVAQLARHDERSRETRREVRRLRRSVHWQASVLTALAYKAGIDHLAPPPTEDDDTDERDSDEPPKPGSSG